MSITAKSTIPALKISAVLKEVKKSNMTLR
jgi:hypothetical protein